MRDLVLTATGEDRPGLVEALSQKLYAWELNIAEARMVNLRGTFALVCLVEGSERAFDALKASLPALAQELKLQLACTDTRPQQSASPALPYTLRAYALDQPGIVTKLSAVLAGHGVNIEELQARTESASFSGEPLFVLSATLRVPASVPIRALRDELSKVGAALNCDVDLDRA